MANNWRLLRAGVGRRTAIILCAGLAFILGMCALVPTDPAQVVSAYDATMDAAVAAIAQATARAREAQAAAAAEQARLRAIAQATASAQQAAIAAQRAAQEAQVTAQAMDASATSQAARATSDALELQSKRQAATATVEAQARSAGATATAQAMQLAATSQALQLQADAERKAAEDADAMRNSRLFWISFAGGAGAIALTCVIAFVFAENRRSKQRHEAQLQLLQAEQDARARIQEAESAERVAQGARRMVIDAETDGAIGTETLRDRTVAGSVPDTVIVQGENAEAAIEAILEANA